MADQYHTSQGWDLTPDGRLCLRANPKFCLHVNNGSATSGSKLYLGKVHYDKPLSLYQRFALVHGRLLFTQSPVFALSPFHSSASTQISLSPRSMDMLSPGMYCITVFSSIAPYPHGESNFEGSKNVSTGLESSLEWQRCIGCSKPIAIGCSAIHSIGTANQTEAIHAIESSRHYQISAPLLCGYPSPVPVLIYSSSNSSWFSLVANHREQVTTQVCVVEGREPADQLIPLPHSGDPTRLPLSLALWRGLAGSDNPLVVDIQVVESYLGETVPELYELDPIEISFGVHLARLRIPRGWIPLRCTALWNSIKDPSTEFKHIPSSMCIAGSHICIVLDNKVWVMKCPWLKLYEIDSMPSSTHEKSVHCPEQKTGDISSETKIAIEPRKNKSTSTQSPQEARQVLEQRIAVLFQQLTKGCEKSDCTNLHCCSSGQRTPMQPNEAAAQAIKWVSSPSRAVDKLCQ